MENQQKKYPVELLAHKGEHDRIDIDFTDKEVLVEWSEGKELPQKIMDAINDILHAYYGSVEGAFAHKA